MATQEFAAVYSRGIDLASYPSSKWRSDTETKVSNWGNTSVEGGLGFHWFNVGAIQSALSGQKVTNIRIAVSRKRSTGDANTLSIPIYMTSLPQSSAGVTTLPNGAATSGTNCFNGGYMYGSYTSVSLTYSTTYDDYQWSGNITGATADSIGQSFENGTFKGIGLWQNSNINSLYCKQLAYNSAAPVKIEFTYEPRNTAPTTGWASVDPAVFKPGQSVTISWGGFGDADSNISYYAIDWSTDDGGTWNRLTTYGTSAGSGSVTDTPGIGRGAREIYRVIAVDTGGLTSNWANTGYTYCNTLPSTPTNVSTSVSIIEPGSNIPVSFTASSDTYGPVSYYEVKMQNAAGVDYNGGTPLIICYSSPGYVPTGGWARGNDWKFLVRAVDELDERSSWSTATSLVRVNSIPANVSNVTITQSIFETGNINVSWTAASDPDGNASSYEVQYATSADNITFGAFGSAGTVPFGTNTISHALTLTRGYYAKYRVRLVDTLGQVGTWVESSTSVRKNIAPSDLSAFSTSTIAGAAINTSNSYKLSHTLSLTVAEIEKASPFNVNPFWVVSAVFRVYNSSNTLIMTLNDQTDFAISDTLTNFGMVRAGSYYITVTQKDASGIESITPLRYPSSGYIVINNGPGSIGNIYEGTGGQTAVQVGANTIKPYSYGSGYPVNLTKVTSTLYGSGLTYTFYYIYNSVEYSLGTGTVGATYVDFNWVFGTYGGVDSTGFTYVASAQTFKLVVSDGEYSVEKTVTINLNNQRTIYNGQVFNPTITINRTANVATMGTTYKEGETFSLTINNIDRLYLYNTAKISWEVWYQTRTSSGGAFGVGQKLQSGEHSITPTLVSTMTAFTTTTFTIPTPVSDSSYFEIRYYVKVKNDIVDTWISEAETDGQLQRVYIWKSTPTFSVYSSKRTATTQMEVVVNLTSIGAANTTNVADDSIVTGAGTAGTTNTRVGIVYADSSLVATPSITLTAWASTPAANCSIVEFATEGFLQANGLPANYGNITLSVPSGLVAAKTYAVVPYVVRYVTGATSATSTTFISYGDTLIVKPLGSLITISPWGISLGEEGLPTALYDSSVEVSRWTPGVSALISGVAMAAGFRARSPVDYLNANSLDGLPYSWNIFFNGTNPVLRWTNGSGVIQSGSFSFVGGLTSGSTSTGYLNYNGTTAAAGQFDGGTTTPTGTTRLNYGGYFYPTYLNLIGSADTTTAASHYYVETGSDGYVRPKTLANVAKELALQLFPVGYIFISTSATSPQTTFGGTWAAYAEGRVLVGKAAAGTFVTAGATGGSETITLAEANLPSHTHTWSGTTAKETAEHTHTYSFTTSGRSAAHTHWWEANTGTVSSDHSHQASSGSYKVGSGSTSTYSYMTWSGSTGGTQTGGISANHYHYVAATTGTESADHTHGGSGTTAGRSASHTHTYSGTTSATGSATAFSNLQPYVVVYMWQRTA